MSEHGIHRGKLVGATGFLALASYAFYGMVFGENPSDVGPDPELLDPSVDEIDDPADGALGSSVEANATARGHKARAIRADLLAAFGTFREGIERSPFRSPVAVPATLTGPRGEGDGGGEWVPPRLDVTMVFRARGVERASVDGAVVGVGDDLAGGVVRRIARDGIELALDGTLLFYELRSPYPRGYEPPAATDAMAAEEDPAASAGDDPAFVDPGGEEKE